MTLEKFEERLKLHNWNYQKYNGERWAEGHHEYKKLIQISSESPEHRNMLLRYKKLNGVI